MRACRVTACAEGHIWIKGGVDFEASYISDTTVGVKIGAVGQVRAACGRWPWRGSTNGLLVMLLW